MLSLLLVFEIDVWLRKAKVIRIVSYFAAILYSIGYFTAAFKFVDIYFDLDDQDPSFIQVYYALFIAYNLMMHAGTELGSLVIIFKEISMRYFQLVRGDAGTKTDDVSLSLHDVFSIFSQKKYY
uniref:Uncharacterized protein n=1 Tax=Strombidium rassoulzadegani TaxID=1082188 RepID=A0A7S3CM11_9SPIT|mmetsp:Transcript_16417/g.27817  ORF Transcript_16417/g.27817 Transcript_16417/m.27817 type:complete len:124 (+) Transcript_16417:717-1088(+)